MNTYTSVVSTHYLWWVSDDGQSTLPMGALEYDYPESKTQEEAELQAWAELQTVGHDMTGRMVWDSDVDTTEC